MCDLDIKTHLETFHHQRLICFVLLSCSAPLQPVALSPELCQDLMGYAAPREEGALTAA